MIAIAPPGCECHPEEPPGVRVILATTISKPCLSGRLARDISVPRPITTLVNPTDGVAAPGIALNATNTPANPSDITAARIPRLLGVFIPLSLSRLSGSSSKPPTGQCAPPASSSSVCVRIFLRRQLDSVPVEQGIHCSGGDRRESEDEGRSRPADSNQAKPGSVPD